MSFPELIIIPPKKIAKENGHCYIINLPELEDVACSVSNPESPYQLFEGDQGLQPVNALHELIRNVGNGAHSHWCGSLLFSSSDNSDPRMNGREYSLRNTGISAEPVNYRQQRVSHEDLDGDVEYALSVGLGYWDLVKEAGITSLKGKTLMEIGPGINFGSAAILACLGADLIYVTDRFLSKWNPGYHPAFYHLLKDKMQACTESFDLTPLDQILKTGGYKSSRIAPIETQLEQLDGIPDDTIDIIFSNAVFEHLVDPVTAFRQLNRASRVGGLGFHQVDFRDHKDFDRPLEFLLFNDKDFKRLFNRCCGECGNRTRPKEMVKIAQECGFTVLNYSTNMYTENEYLEEFMPRLRKSRSRYTDWDKNDLSSISGRLYLKKKNALKPEHKSFLGKIKRLFG
ncbi:class I SAM-dependent methyltransferase [Maridesulfovibrio sp.]|uniref:class I SAM-dependent methyltransferase n=1 Tax=Maridesulfovibrio sp. TaxID=2795000 RepID=UPI003BAD7469